MIISWNDGAITFFLLIFFGVPAAVIVWLALRNGAKKGVSWWRRIQLLVWSITVPTATIAALFMWAQAFLNDNILWWIGWSGFLVIPIAGAAFGIWIIRRVARTGPTIERE